MRYLKFHKRHSNASGDDSYIFRNTSSHNRSRSGVKSNTISHHDRSSDGHASPVPPKHSATFSKMQKGHTRVHGSDENQMIERSYNMHHTMHASIFPPISKKERKALSKKTSKESIEKLHS